jgi:hypothetical protein
MRLGEPEEWQHFEVTEIMMREQIWEDIMAVLVPRPRGRTRTPAKYNLKRWIRRIAGEIFVGIDVNIGRMIDREQLYLVQILRAAP